LLALVMMLATSLRLARLPTRRTAHGLLRQNLVTYLGVDITNPSDDYTLATQARNAANDFCYRRRQESGYFDSLTTSPGHDVTLGTLMYAAALWRSRGSVQDTFATFDGMGNAPVSAMTPMIKQLLGIDRPQVA
jgi:hypothetical protein